MSTQKNAGGGGQISSARHNRRATAPWRHEGMSRKRAVTIRARAAVRSEVAHEISCECPASREYQNVTIRTRRPAMIVYKYIRLIAPARRAQMGVNFAIRKRLARPASHRQIEVAIYRQPVSSQVEIISKNACAASCLPSMPGAAILMAFNIAENIVDAYLMRRYRVI